MTKTRLLKALQLLDDQLVQAQEAYSKTVPHLMVDEAMDLYRAASKEHTSAVEMVRIIKDQVEKMEDK